MSTIHTEVIGRVAAPPDKESTTGEFYFWVHHNKTIERTQIVRTRSRVGTRDVTFVGVVQEVYRRSRQKDVSEESDRFDAGRGAPPMFDSEGVTYAKASVLRTRPVAYTPPVEESEVFLANDAEAREGYGVDNLEHPLEVGLLRNGGEAFAGRATLDLDYLLGENGGHLNVNGIAGLGSKSSFLLHVLWLLLREAERQAIDRPSDRDRLQLAPIVFNVKNYDLFFIDKWNKKYREDELAHSDDWRRLGVETPTPFVHAKFLAPQIKGGKTPVPVGRSDTEVKPYSWALTDVIEKRLFKFLFADDAIYEPNFGGLVDELEEWLTHETSGGPRLGNTNAHPQSFQKLLDDYWNLPPILSNDYVKSTKAKVYRHLKFIIRGGEGILRKTDTGNPISIVNSAQPGPTVIDLFALRMTPMLQRFVVAAVFHQLVELRSNHVVAGLRFVVVLDELNRFAPRNSADPITQIIETVAAEMRSQGVILLGAQQQASLVAQRVIANCAVKAIGRSDTLELGSDVWKALDRSARSLAAQLQADEKLLIQPNFREPMLVKIPFPPFALKLEHEDHAARPGEAPPAAPWQSTVEADF
jgi:DNA helicase HerA-like ATPase